MHSFSFVSMNYNTSFLDISEILTQIVTVPFKYNLTLTKINQLQVL